MATEINACEPRKNNFHGESCLSESYVEPEEFIQNICCRKVALSPPFEVQVIQIWFYPYFMWHSHAISKKPICLSAVITIIIVLLIISVYWSSWLRLVFTPHSSLNLYKTWTHWNCTLGFHSRELAHMGVLTGKGGWRQGFGYYWKSGPHACCRRRFSDNLGSSIIQFSSMWNISLDLHSRTVSSKEKRWYRLSNTSQGCLTLNELC